VVIVKPPQDVQPPVVLLKGESFITMFLGESFEDPGADLEDNVDELKDALVTGEVDPNQEGVYVLTYYGSDAAGNRAVPVTRIIHVIALSDQKPPVITLKGDSFIVMRPGPNSFTDPGATALDEVDGDVVVNVSGDIAWDQEGVYALTYTAVDQAGNAATPVVRVIMISSTMTETGSAQTLGSRLSQDEGKAPSDMQAGDLNIQRLDSSHLLLRWSGSYRLTYARHPQGPYRWVEHSSSPHLISTEIMGFYRLEPEAEVTK